MLFIIGLPVMQIILFCLSIGKDPVGLRMAIVNHELNKSSDMCKVSTGCDWSYLSCRYLQHLQNRKVVYLNYDSENEAKYAVEKGWAWGSIVFQSNFSGALKDRIENGRDAEEWNFAYADMKIALDLSSEFLFYFLI